MTHADSNESFDALRHETWNEQDAVARVAARLDGAHGRVARRRRSRTRLLAMVLPAILLVGTTVAATAIAVQRARLYDVTISDDGEVISNPRLLVLPGQTATMTITDANGETTTVSVHEDGEATVETNTEHDVAVDVTEIESPAASVQRLYRMTIFVGDDEVAAPSLLVNHGEKAQVVIDDGEGDVLTVSVDENGEVRAAGIEGVRVEYDVIEMP